MEEVKECSLSILVLSDTHMNKEAMNDLQRYKREHPEEFALYDLVIHCGDFSTQESDPRDAINPPSLVDFNYTTTWLNATFPEIKRGFFVPGNHDAAEMFPKPQGIVQVEGEGEGEGEGVSNIESNIETNIENIHLGEREIAANLRIVGLGGSIPCKQLQKDKKAWMDVWHSYPYKDDGDFSKDLQLVKTYITQGITDAPKIRYILLTHLGAYSSPTSIMQAGENPNPFMSGSKALEEMIKSKDFGDKLFLNIHGHSHLSQGVYKMEEVTIINPGAVCLGQFAQITLDVGQDLIYSLKQLKFRSFPLTNP